MSSVDTSVQPSKITVLIMSILAFACVSASGQETSLTLDHPAVALSGDSIVISFPMAAESSHLELHNNVRVQVGEQSAGIVLKGDRGQATLAAEGFGATPISVSTGGTIHARSSVTIIPGWLSLVPALLAIAVALMLRQVLVALFLGVWVGAWIYYGLSVEGLWFGLLDSLQVYVLRTLAPPDGSTDHMSIILFTLMIGGMIGIISRNGGTRGIVEHITAWANSPRRGQAVTGFLGLLVFFDDYANTLVVGNTMRPITDRLRVSREKLAYLVDSTAAPVACLALVTTWIGFEIGLIGDSLQAIGLSSISAYSFFLHSIPYSFYPILALVFVFMIALSGRDFGPMLRAERRARQTGQVFAPDASVADNSTEGREMEVVTDKPHRAVNAVVPVLVLVLGTLIGLLVTGEAGGSLRDIIGSADSYKAILWASLGSVAAAITLTLAQRLLSLAETVDAWFQGLKSMMFAVLILVLAWALADINGALHTADFLVSVLGSSLNPGFLAAGVFILAAFTAFATGSSWGTMSILIPLVLPLSWAVLGGAGLSDDPGAFAIMYLSTSAVLAGAVWGDHCSPISDTTILSSMATGCDHVDHVRTQMPYAMLVGGVSLFVCILPVGFGVAWWLALPAGVAVLALALRFFAQTVDNGVDKSTTA